MPFWIAFGCVGVAMIVFALFLRGLDHPTALAIPADAIAPSDGQAWVVDLKDQPRWPWEPRGDTLFDPFRSDLRLFEDGRPLGPPHTATARVQQDGGGAYVHWDRLLVFSTPDGSDPRVNGRAYRVEFTAGVRRIHLRQVADTGTLLVAIALAGLALGQRRALAGAILGASGGFVRALPRRLPDWLLAALIPATLAWLTWSGLPALWNGSDSVIWLLWQLTWIPHHPPVYPLLLALLERATGGDAAAMLHSVMLIQHTLQVIAVAWVATAFRGWWRILLVAAAASIGTSYGLFGHGLFTEGLAHPLLLLVLGALFRLWRDGPTRSVFIALGVTLLLASLTRYLMIVFVGLPVLYLLLIALRRYRLRAGWRAVGLAVLLAVGVFGANSAINAWLSLLLDAETAPMLGRPGIYRIQDAYKLTPPAERAAWLAALQARTDDPALRAALPIIARVDNPWNGPRDALAVEPALWGQHPDELMTAGVKLYLLWPHPSVLAQWAQEFPRALFGTPTWRGGVGQVRHLLLETAAAFDSVFPRDPRAVAAVAASGAGGPDAAAAFTALAGRPWARLADLPLPIAPPARAWWLALSLVLLVAAVVRSRDVGLTSLMLTLWGGALAYLLTLTLLSVALPRYLAPVDLLIWLSNGLALLVLVSADRGAAARAAGDQG